MTGKTGGQLKLKRRSRGASVAAAEDRLNRRVAVAIPGGPVGKTDGQTSSATMEEAVRATGSRVGFVALLSGDGDSLAIRTWPRTAEQLQSVRHSVPLDKATSLPCWLQSVTEPEPVVVNTPAEGALDAQPYPGGHVDLERWMSVSVRSSDRIVGVLSVGGKPVDYQPEDTHCLSFLAADMWGAIQRRHALEALEVSERRYRLLVETMSEGLGSFDENCYVTYANERLCRLVECPPESITGRSVADFLDDTNQSLFYDQMAKSKEGGQYPCEIDWTTSSGRRVPSIVSPQPLFDSSGNFIGSFAVVTDISSRKEAEDLLRASEEKYRGLVEGLNEAVYRKAVPSGEYEYVSPAIETVFGYSPEEAMANPLLIRENIHPDFVDYYEFHRNELLRGRVAQTFEYKMIDPDSKERWILQSNTGVYDDDGKLIAVEGICRNITERKQAEDALKAANAKLAAEQATLVKKNITLREVMSQIEIEKREIQQQVQANVDRILMPIVRSLRERSDDDLQAYVKLLDECLADITAPFIRQLEQRFARLSPREVAIAQMIRSGMSTKDIAGALNTSVHTVHNQRKRIRKKLGISSEAINLGTFLRTI